MANVTSYEKKPLIGLKTFCRSNDEISYKKIVKIEMTHMIVFMLIQV